MLSFRVTAAAYAMMLVLAYVAYMRPFGNEMDAFTVLLCMAILACVALWPRSGDRSDAADSMRRTWADRIDLAPGGAADAGRAGGGGLKVAPVGSELLPSENNARFGTTSGIAQPVDPDIPTALVRIFSIGRRIGVPRALYSSKCGIAPYRCGASATRKDGDAGQVFARHRGWIPVGLRSAMVSTPVIAMYGGEPRVL